MGRCCGSATAVAVWLLLFFVVTVAAPAAATGGGAGPRAAQAPTDACQWGLRGAGFHMQFAVEFPLHYEEVEISFELPRAFFFDAAEAEQLYTITAPGGVEVAGNYTSLDIRSKFFFDIEAPAFRVAYEANSVRLGFARLPPATKGAAAAGPSPAGKGLLLLPIHARYEAVDAVTPFSFRAFFNRESFVRRCIPEVDVRDNKTAARCHTLPALTGEENRGRSGSAAAWPKRPSNCQDIPVPLLSSLPVVYVALLALQCTGAAVVVLSLLRV
ncbi:uncharacterized protein Tco025E_05006 [Trypanosoma conorhini]|uniref:Uncharacterized protein n=1 Tax=Trypanosoma conorhini TaxID=83891 RepID=A0A422PGR1_9TRYP|nr:uncharacterized protein Tco025E_05006 [Trypanosoma conorhini]RNF16881.1 hypothetical protein Tco025E_05006 [Trypanosoma conorhini]